MSALTFAQKQAKARLRQEAERQRYAVATAAGFRSPDSLRSRAIRMIGVLVKLMLTTGTAGQGFTAANDKVTAFGAQGAAVMNGLAAFEAIDGHYFDYLAEIDALETVEAVTAWEAQSRVWD